MLLCICHSLNVLVFVQCNYDAATVNLLINAGSPLNAGVIFHKCTNWHLNSALYSTQFYSTLTTTTLARWDSTKRRRYLPIVQINAGAFIRSFTVCIFIVLPSLHLFTIFNLSSIIGIYLNSTNWLRTVMLIWYFMSLLLWLYFGMNYVTAFIFMCNVYLVWFFLIDWRGYCEFNLSLYKWNYLYYKTKV